MTTATRVAAVRAAVADDLRPLHDGTGVIEEELDEALARRSLDEGVSKAALIRRFVRQSIIPMPAMDEDPLSGMIGADDVEPAAVDDVVYR